MIFTEPRENPRFRRRRLMVKEKNSVPFFLLGGGGILGESGFFGQTFWGGCVFNDLVTWLVVGCCLF